MAVFLFGPPISTLKRKLSDQQTYEAEGMLRAAVLSSPFTMGLCEDKDVPRLINKDMLLSCPYVSSDT